MPSYDSCLAVTTTVHISTYDSIVDSIIHGRYANYTNGFYVSAIMDVISTNTIKLHKGTEITSTNSCIVAIYNMATVNLIVTLDAADTMHITIPPGGHAHFMPDAGYDIDVKLASGVPQQIRYVIGKAV